MASPAEPVQAVRSMSDSALQGPNDTFSTQLTSALKMSTRPQPQTRKTSMRDLPFLPRRSTRRESIVPVKAVRFSGSPKSDSSDAAPPIAIDPADSIDLDSEEKVMIPDDHRWKTFFSQEVARDSYLEAQMMLLTLCTGIIDAVTFSAYHVFTSKQTGNTILLALYAFTSNSEEGVEKNVGTSMGFFILGSAVFGHIGHKVKQRRRSWLVLSNLIQASLVSTATCLSHFVHHSPHSNLSVGVISVLAFAAGGQIALALCVRMPELNTTMITGTLIQLSTDPDLLKIKNRPRNRRILFFCSLLAGGFIGAACVKKASPALGLLLAAAMKIVVCISFFFNYGIIRDPNAKDIESGVSTPLTRMILGD